MGIDMLSIVYIIYAALSVGLTVWLAHTLSKNGAVFLRDVFADNPDLAASVNKLLVVGFYLMNLGYACFLLDGGYADTPRAAIETLASKMGALLLSLGVMHFINLFIFHRVRRRARLNAAPPPPPVGHLAPSTAPIAS